MITEAQLEILPLSNLPQVEYSNWYVIQIALGKEQYVQDLIDEVYEKKVKTMYFTRKIIHKKDNGYKKLITPLFPGYIFIHEHIKEVEHLLRSRLFSIYFKTVSFGMGPVKVGKEEMELLLSHCDESGVFDLSQGIKEGERITISSGPLKNIKGNIVFINEKKRKAKVKLTLFKKEMEISLGLEVISKSSIPY